MRYLKFIERELERCYYRIWCYSRGRGVNACGFLHRYPENIERDRKNVQVLFY